MILYDDGGGVRILVACEESQVVCKAFRERGHEAYSCDIIECSGGHPEWHIRDDVLSHLEDGWDMMIAHPPCTYLTVTANRSFINNPDRWKKRLDAMLFVHTLLNAPIRKICLENPVSVISTHIRKPDQIIQPWMFGHEAQKTTCLWLKNLPALEPTDIVGKGEFVVFKSSGKKMPKWYADFPSTNRPDNAKLRSKTFRGIAEAMSLQWA